MFDNSLNRKNPEKPNTHIKKTFNFNALSESFWYSSLSFIRMSMVIGSFLLTGFARIRFPPSRVSCRNFSSHGLMHEA